jgi:hypothetical protein
MTKKENRDRKKELATEPKDHKAAEERQNKRSLIFGFNLNKKAVNCPNCWAWVSDYVPGLDHEMNGNLFHKRCDEVTEMF